MKSGNFIYNNIFGKIRLTSSLIIIMFIYAVFITGGTYAYLYVSANSNNKITGTASCGNISYNGTEVIGENLNSSSNYIDGAHSVITLSKNSNSGYAEATIYLHNNTGSTIPFNSGADGADAFKYIVLDGANTIASGVIEKSNKDQKLVTVPLTTTSKNYDIYIWIDSSLSNGLYNDASYSGYIYASAICNTTIDGTRSLYATIIENAELDNTSSTYVSSSSGINFDANNSDTNGKGVYIRAGTENDAHPIYYYRGDIDNNNVIFANMCFKIVRTTDIGGIKMIYNGVPTDGKCNNTGDNTTIGTKAFNTNSSSLADVGYMYGTRYVYAIGTSTGWYYAPDVTYANGTYTLTSKGSYSVETKSTISGTNLSYQHYTCGSSTGTTCTSVRYVYYVSGSTAYYISLTNGKKIEDALSDMLDYNITSSTIKGDNTTSGTLDYWYYNNIEQQNDSKGNSYSSYIEDTVYCNDRSFNNYTASGWNPDGGSTSTYLRFGAYGRTTNPIVTCPRNIDKFAVSSAIGNGTLDYPVGLLTEDEVRMAGGSGSNNNVYYLYNAESLWLASPNYFNDAASEFYVYATGSLKSTYVFVTNGVRPSVTLSAGTKIKDGDGTSEDPYIITER